MLKGLAADAVEKVGNGHPGTAISLAAAAYVLYRDHLRYDPKDPHWLGRDRFVLSIGHASILQYSQLFLHGLGLELSDLQQFRTLGSKTPGHPEVFHTDFVEITTGPLGSGIASAVGMAMASRRAHGMLDGDNSSDSIFDHNVYTIAGDGDMQEGITHEACALAGTQKLGNLVVIYDDNDISIEGHTSIAFTEDVEARFTAYGWDVQTVDWTNGGSTYQEDPEALSAAIDRAKRVNDKPSLIRLRTIIGWPSPTKSDTGGIHGAKLGAEELAGLKERLGIDPEVHFWVDNQVVSQIREASSARGRELRSEWDAQYGQWRSSHPAEARLLDRLVAHELPEGWEDTLPQFDSKPVATRSASGAVINALAPVLPELWGGSADLAGSNNTVMKSEPSFIPEDYSTTEFTGNRFGRNLHFGIREHGMGAILNGIALSGLFKPYGGTFMVFSDYMRGSVRLAALMGLPVTYVWTHDSIGVGEDGPTHQPVEHLASLRAIPGLDVVRPADANETKAAWKHIVKHQARPTALALTRQNVPCLDRAAEGLADAENLSRGAYVLRDSDQVDAIIIATGSEVQVALAAQKQLESEGIGTRVVSAPCLEWFDEQDEEYRESVIPAHVKARVSVEAGIDMPWFKYLGDSGKAISLNRFGAPGSGEELFDLFGFTAKNVAKTVKGLLS
ncbi:transketolase [Boudabousia marimammalium]|uniref:Transketolase n=2 Tax=Boudabousia marimammalium TaxID=156892 RepID=A0A1Q5PRF9_9ACTO|nr:transketolase [Boudabousia marimammalium]